MSIEISVSAHEVPDTGCNEAYWVRTGYDESREIRVPVVEDDGTIHTVIIEGAQPALGHRKVDLDSEDKQAAIVKALQVMVLDRDHRRWMESNDPNALKQATEALEAIGEPHDPYPINLGLSIR